MPSAICHLPSAPCPSPLFPLPSSITTADQSARIDRVKSYHAGFLKSFASQMGYAFLAGSELLALKAATPHGQFEDLKETQFQGISRSSLGRYMSFAEAIQAKYPTVGYLNSPLLLTNGTLSEEDQSGILQAIHDFADGKTLTQLYRDLGVIRDKLPPAHHPIKDRTPDQIIADENAQAQALVDAASDAIAVLLLDLDSKTGTLAARIDPTQWKQLTRACVSLNKRIRPLSKRKASRA